TPSQTALGVHSLYRLLQTVAADDYGDRQLARTLCDRDDVHLHARDRGEDTPSQSGMSLHAFADRRQQPDVAVHGDRMHIAVGELERERLLQRLHGAIQLILAHQEAEALAVTGTRHHQYFDIHPRDRVEGARHHLHAVDFGACRLERHQGDIAHRCDSARTLRHGHLWDDARAGLFGCEAILA